MEVEQQQEVPILLLRSSKKRLMIARVAKTLVGVCVIIGSGWLFSALGGFEVFGEVLQAFGITIRGTAFVAAGAVTSGGALLLVALVTLGGTAVEYHFTATRLVAKARTLLMFKQEWVVPYDNIERVLVKETGIVKTLCGLGTVVLQLTGLPVSEFRITDIESAGKNAAYIQQLVQRGRMQRFMHEQQERRVSQIVQGL